MTADVKPIFTTNLSDLEAAAAKVLSEAARRHLLAWAGGAAAVRANARALRAWRIVPRMFIDRDERDLSATVLGVEMPAPVILGPVGSQALAHPDGEAATARAAAGLDLTYVHSSRSSKSVEGVAAAAPRARGGSAWTGRAGRPRPRAAQARAARGVHPPRALTPAAREGLGGARGDPRRLGRADRPQRHPDRAGRADGGPPRLRRHRRVERARAPRSRPVGTIDALPRIADAVGGKVAVLFGSGVRTGTDVYRALALGAEAVLIGRPYVHGLALGGEAGVRHMLRTLLAELDITLAIAGVATTVSSARARSSGPERAGPPKGAARRRLPAPTSSRR